MNSRSVFASVARVALWPAFLMAGVLEMLVFAVLDPADMRWFGGELIGWSAQAVYTVTFLIFWLVISIATGLTALLMQTADEVNADELPAPSDDGAGTGRDVSSMRC
jgi:uncharacterized membrane protein YcfT